MSRRAAPAAWIGADPPALIRQGEASVYLAWLDLPEVEVESLAPLLSADEHARAGRFHFGSDSRRFVVARATLRLLLGSYLNVAAADVRFHYGTSGKPSLDPQQNSGNLRFNVAHADGLALYGLIRDQEIGIDVERQTGAFNCLDIAERFFSATENQVIRSLPPDERLHAFYAFWTRKEAYVKGIGSGLGMDLDQFSVSLAAAPVQIRGSGENTAAEIGGKGGSWVASSWLVYAVEVPPGYFAALAVEGEITELQQWEVTSRDRSIELVRPE